MALPLAADGVVLSATMSQFRPHNEGHGWHGDRAPFRDDMHTFKRIYFKGKDVMLAPVNTAYAPATRKEREILRKMKVWGVKF